MRLRFCAVLAAASVFLAPAFAQDTTTASAPAAEAPAIAAAPLNVHLTRTRGSAAMLNGQPKIALGGYNIGAFITTRVTASSGGSLLGNSAGARARMDFALAGIDRALLQRIADAAHADLVAQLQGAGFEVITASEVFANGRGASLLAPNGVYGGEEPGTQSELLVAGPNGVGAVNFMGVGRTSIGGMNSVAPVSRDLQAIVLFPNLALDFVETSGSGNRALGNRANVAGEARFGVDAMTKAEILYSRSGRFADGWATLQAPEGVGVDDVFATTELASESNNNAAAAISGVLGAAMQRSRREGYLVTADAAAYEALALRAARGFNAALVAQIRDARR